MSIGSGETSTEHRGELWDLLVIGAGPAGAVAALEAARRGLRVRLVERRRFPRDKLCGACLNARALTTLDRLGLRDLPPRLGAIPVRRFELSVGGRRLELELPGGAVIGRSELDAALVSAAVEAGASFHDATAASVAPAAPDDDERRTSLAADSAAGVRRTEFVRSRLVIAADGLGSPSLHRLAEFDSPAVDGGRIGLGAILKDRSGRPTPGSICMAVGTDGYVGTVRLPDGRLNVAAAVAPGRLSDGAGPASVVRALLQEAGVEPFDTGADGVWRGTPPLRRRPRRVVARRLILAGDAAGYVEPFTGEGVAGALECGRLAALAAVEATRNGWSDGLEARWIAAHRRVALARQSWCRALSTLLRHPRLARAAAACVGRWPALCAPVIRSLNRADQDSWCGDEVRV